MIVGEGECLSMGGQWHPESVACEPDPCDTWILHVHPDGTGDYPTIQAAVDAARSGDIVELADGTYAGPGNHPVEIMSKSITVRSESGNPDACIIDCEYNWRALDIGDVAEPGTTLENLTFVNGRVDWEQGGAILMGGGAATLITHCRFLNCQGWGGGAISCSGARATIDNCLFSGNSASVGGALLTSSSPTGSDTVVVNGCTFEQNLATEGGAINAASPLRVRACTFVGNGSPMGSSVLGSGTVENSILTFGSGGTAVASYGEPPSMLCCDVFGNSGGDWTGCIADQLGVNGNISEDPLLCDTVNPNGERYTIGYDSPCAAGHDPGCGQIGAWPVGCGIGACCVENDLLFPSTRGVLTAGRALQSGVALMRLGSLSVVGRGGLLRGAHDRLATAVRRLQRPVPEQPG